MWRPEPLEKESKWSEGISISLKNYLDISKDLKLARFKLAYSLETYELEKNRDLKHITQLWDQHHKYYQIFKDLYSQKKTYKNRDQFLSYFQKISASKSPKISFLDLKVKIAERITESCNLCEKRCGVNRSAPDQGELGYCKVHEPIIASEFLHIGEEAPLVPSHTIFFTGCTLECVFCQNWNISQISHEGTCLSEKKLAGLIDHRRRQGSLNVNFVGGEPTPHLPYILRTLSFCKENIPVVWNSNFYMSLESMQLLMGVVDLYLSDFKFGNDDCASQLSGADNYWDIVRRNHLIASEAGDLIIRHLVLPGHVECCTKPILSWIKENLGKDTVVNIMGQYHPNYHAHQYPEISRFPREDEMREAFQWALQIGLNNLI